jgi:hypothetical protein
MVIKGHYLGLPLADLESARTQLFAALESARKGNRFSEVDMGGKMGKKALLSYNEIVHELKEVEYALKKALPDVYGKPIKRLVPNFNPALARMTCVPNSGKVYYLPEEQFYDDGATARDPVEGLLVATRIDTPDMTITGEHKIRYEAFNSQGQRVEGIRKITVVDSIYVLDLEPIHGGVVNDDTLFWNRGISTINRSVGYYADKDYQVQIIKENNRWSLYDYSGVKHDEQKSASALPLTMHSDWGIIKVRNDDIRQII